MIITNRVAINRENARHSTRLRTRAHAYETSLVTKANALDSISLHEQCVSPVYKPHNEPHQAAPATGNEPRSPYNATKVGFVFANNEIESNIRGANRRTAVPEQRDPVKYQHLVVV